MCEGKAQSRTYIYRAPQCMSPRWNWDSPPPIATSEYSQPPGPKGGGAHSPAAKGVGESQFQQLENRLALCLLCEVRYSNGKTSLVHYRTLSFFAFRLKKNESSIIFVISSTKSLANLFASLQYCKPVRFASLDSHFNINLLRFASIFKIFNMNIFAPLRNKFSN